MQWNDLFSADNPSERTTAFCHRGPQLTDGSTLGLTAIYGKISGFMSCTFQGIRYQSQMDDLSYWKKGYPEL